MHSRPILSHLKQKTNKFRIPMTKISRQCQQLLFLKMACSLKSSTSTSTRNLVSYTRIFMVPWLERVELVKVIWEFLSKCLFPRFYCTPGNFPQDIRDDECLWTMQRCHRSAQFHSASQPNTLKVWKMWRWKEAIKVSYNCPLSFRSLYFGIRSR